MDFGVPANAMRGSGCERLEMDGLVFGQCWIVYCYCFRSVQGVMFVCDGFASFYGFGMRRVHGVEGASWFRDSCLWWGVKSANRQTLGELPVL